MVVMVEATVNGVYKQEKESSTETLVVLKANDQERYLPIWISPPQAMSIAQYLQGVKGSRPDTYRFMAQLIERLGGQVDAVHVASLENATYYAILRLMVSNVLEEVDCRPSDALALAMEVGASIFVDAEVLAQHGCDGATSFHDDFMGTLHPLEFKAAE
jgi:bifunctional DNase/RNase